MFVRSFIDFDNTIYDTVALERDMRDTFLRYGVKEADYRETFWKSLCTDSPDKFDYSFSEQVEFLRKRNYDLPSKIVADLEALFKNDYLFPDARDFIKDIKKISQKVILLSAGDHDFQYNKFLGARVLDWFDEVIIVSGKQEKHSIGAASTGKKLFVNDNLEENKLMKSIADCLVVTKLNEHKWTRDDAEQIGVPCFKTLTEIKNFLLEYE